MLDLHKLEYKIKQICGVVESGLFLAKQQCKVIVGRKDQEIHKYKT